MTAHVAPTNGSGEGVRVDNVNFESPERGGVRKLSIDTTVDAPIPLRR